MEPLRIVLYSHDSVGLGHVRRNLALAHALNNQLPGLIGRPVTGILITGTALAPAFRLPEGWDWVLLPGVAKGSAGYLPRNLTLPMGELVPLRARLLQATLAGFSPTWWWWTGTPRAFMANSKQPCATPAPPGPCAWCWASARSLTRPPRPSPNGPGWAVPAWSRPCSMPSGSTAIPPSTIP